MLIPNPLKKLQKIYAKKVTENGALDFYFCLQKFSTYNLFCLFLLFFQRIRIQHKNFALLWYP